MWSEMYVTVSLDTILAKAENSAIHAVKSAPPDVIPVRIECHRMTLDRDGEQVLPGAFDEATVRWFVDHGVIDWKHGTIFGQTEEEKAGSIIGKPKEFSWEEGIPVVYAWLTRNHPIVRDSIEPHLAAGQGVFYASIGGKKKIEKVYDYSENRHKNVVPWIHWDSLAIAPSFAAKSSGCSVTLAKAGDQYMRILQFGSEAELEQRSELLEESNAEPLFKAIEAGFATDAEGASGFDALRRQSLEGSIAAKTDAGMENGLEGIREIVAKVLDHLREERVAPSIGGLAIALRAEGIPSEKADGVAREIAESVANHI